MNIKRVRIYHNDLITAKYPTKYIINKLLSEGAPLVLSDKVKNALASITLLNDIPQSWISDEDNKHIGWEKGHDYMEWHWKTESKNFN